MPYYTKLMFGVKDEKILFQFQIKNDAGNRKETDEGI